MSCYSEIGKTNFTIKMRFHKVDSAFLHRILITISHGNAIGTMSVYVYLCENLYEYS